MFEFCYYHLPLFLFQNKHTTLFEIVKIEWAPTLEVQKFNKRPGRLIE